MPTITVHMGTTQQKQELSGKLLGVTPKAVKEVFKTSATTLPCVYLFALGTVKQLRGSMNINEKYTDECIIAKYGSTHDLIRRTYEHEKTFGKIKNVNINLKYHCYMDPMYTSQGENDIKDFFNGMDMHIKYEKHEGIVAIKPEHIKIIEVQYKQISNAYGGHIKDMIKK